MAVLNRRTTLELTYQCPHATSLLEDFSPIDNPIMTPVGAKADVCRRQVRLIVIATLGPVKAQPGVSAEIKDRKSTRLNSSHVAISYAVFCLKKKRRAPSATHSTDRRGPRGTLRPYSRTAMRGS